MSDYTPCRFCADTYVVDGAPCRMCEPGGIRHDRIHADSGRLVKATPLTLRQKPVEHLAPDTIDDDRERAAAK